MEDHVWEQFVESLQTTDVSALIAKVVDPVLLEYVRKYDVLDAALPMKSWATNIFYFNQHDQFPEPQMVTETGAAAASKSNWTQQQINIRHYQSNGDVGDFAVQTAHQSIVDLLTSELRNHAQAVRWMRANKFIYGDETATLGGLRPDWNGFDVQIDAGNKVVASAGAGNTIALIDLDNAIDSIEIMLGAGLYDDDFFFVFSPPAISEISRLQAANFRTETPVKLVPRRDNGVVGSPVNQVDGGFEVNSYRGIPLVKSSFLTPRGTMSTPTAAAAGTDGTLAAGTYAYAIDVVCKFGPTQAVATASVTVAATNHVDLTFTTPSIPDALGKPQANYLYRVYRGPAAGPLTLIGTVGANDASDAAVTAIRDTGSALIGNAGANQITGHYFTGPEVAITAPKVEHGYLITRAPDLVCVPTVNEMKTVMLAKNNARTTQFAVLGDCALAFRAPKFGAKICNFKTA